MKMGFALSIVLLLLISGCDNGKNSSDEVYVDNSEALIAVGARTDSIKSNIQLISDRTSSRFKTPIQAYFFTNGVIVDSIIEPDFEMSSWYLGHKDSIYLSAHIGSFETRSLLLRFVDGKFNVSFLRAPHSDQLYFRINKNDPFSSHIEVPPLRYELQLTQIPDTINKPVVYGYIDMETLEYYDKRDTLDQRHKVQMKFYFRSQFRKFN